MIFYQWSELKALAYGSQSQRCIGTCLEYLSPWCHFKRQSGSLLDRRAKMVFTRHRFISSLGDDAEKYYQKKYLLSVPITEDHDVVLNPPKSWAWVELCAQSGICDAHLDALSCNQKSQGFTPIN